MAGLRSSTVFPFVGRMDCDERSGLYGHLFPALDEASGHLFAAWPPQNRTRSPFGEGARREESSGRLRE